MLLRQVHPSFIHNGRPSSQVFRPTPKDESKLSAYDGSKIQPGASWEHYTGVLNFDSAGVLGVSKGECEGVSLPVIEDGVPFPEHCAIDFSGLDKNNADKKGKLLHGFALKRNWLFQKQISPPDPKSSTS